METKFKVGDKIEITEVGEYTKPYFRVNDIGIIIEIFKEGYRIDFNIQKNSRVVSDGFFYTYNDKSNPSFAHFKLYREEKPRFYNAQHGDDVYCRLKGYGIILSLIPFRMDKDDIKAIKIRWDDDSISNILLDGRHNIDHKEATVFYRKGSDYYLTERPEIEIDWAKVPMNTQVFVSDDEFANPQNAVSFFGYFPELEKPFWIFIGMTEENAEGFKYCKLAEHCKPEWRK